MNVIPHPRSGPLLERSAFMVLLDCAVQAAEPLSAPLLFVIDIAGLKDIAAQQGPEAQARLAQLAAERVAGVLGDHGYVCALRGSRLAVLAASDCGPSADAIGNAVLASLAQPIMDEGLVLKPGAVLGMARWGIDGFSVDELFVAADLRLQKIDSIEACEEADCLSLIGPHAPQVRFRESPLRAFA